MIFARTKLLFLTLAAVVVVSIPAKSAPGYQTSVLKVSHRDQALPLHIWYPVKDTNKAELLGNNAVFVGVEVHVGAVPKAGKFPLVLLSHGSGGNSVNIGWIAAKLVDLGAIVVSTDHPGTTSRDSHPRETLKIWQRAKDFSAILDHFQNATPFKLSPDMARVGAVGFSLGGHTVLSLAGARVSKQKYEDYCDRYPGFLDCAWFNSANVKLSDIDVENFEISNLDRRIKAVVAIDPALAQAYNLYSLREISTPVLVINLGADEQVPAGINGAEIEAELVKSSLVNIQRATHFSFLGECTKRGEQIIKSVGEEPICSEASDRKRFAIHQEVGNVISEFFKQNLGL